MATVLEKYRNMQTASYTHISEQNTPSETMLYLQELNYRICVLETLQAFVKAAPHTTDTKVLSYHYQLVDAYIRFLESERKFGMAIDAEGKKRRETAAATLATVITDNRKRFSSFQADSPDKYKTEIRNLITTVLPVWIQYRNTYINL